MSEVIWTRDVEWIIAQPREQSKRSWLVSTDAIGVFGSVRMRG